MVEGIFLDFSHAKHLVFQIQLGSKETKSVYVA